MKKSLTQFDWQAHLASELPAVQTLLAKHGYILNDDQPHIKGERFLMQAMTTTGGRKLILLGHKDGEQVVIKITNDAAGKDELQHERLCRKTLHEIDFAYDTYHSPREIDFFTIGSHLISIHEFIPQVSTFLERPLQEQFNFSLKALRAQESARATTKKHFRRAARLFGNRTSADYLRHFEHFVIFLKNEKVSSTVLQNISQAQNVLKDQKERIEQYCGFLTHTDFVPHNFRITGDKLYLLDFSSLQFGNKHESWARFLNFMTLYNHKLENLLIQYIMDNRAPEERESLQLMRLFKLGEIISYYANTLKNSTGQLNELNQIRVHFWNDVLSAELTNTRVSRDVVVTYQNARDTLRSEDEKERQIGLH